MFNDMVEVCPYDAEEFPNMNKLEKHMNEVHHDYGDCKYVKP